MTPPTQTCIDCGDKSEKRVLIHPLLDQNGKVTINTKKKKQSKGAFLFKYGSQISQDYYQF